MIKHKSTLAKLMARENITVQYGNYQTAWFDIKDRILGLPTVSYTHLRAHET